jgi:hypothetical protein
MRALLALGLCALLTYDTHAARESLPLPALLISALAIVALFLYAAADANGAFDTCCHECAFSRGHQTGCSRRGA